MDTSSGLILLGLLMIGAAIFSFLLSTTILWGATKLLKFKEGSFKKSMQVIGALWLIIIVVGAAAFGLSAIAPLGGLLLGLIFILTCIASPVILALLVKRTFNETWTNTIIAVLVSLGLSVVLYIVFYFVIMVPMVVMWQLGVFSAGDSGGTVAKDWNHLQPLMPTTVYSANDQKFESTFDNAAETSIQITGASLQETYSGVSCSPALINGAQINGEGVKVGPGNTFTVSATCMNSGKNRGDQYLMTIDFQYNEVIGGITTTHNEVGTIRGNTE